MNISRKIVLTGVVTLGVFALGSAGAAAVAHTLTVEDRAGVVQQIVPVTTGTTSPSPSASPLDDKSVEPTGTTTVAPAAPTYVDDDGEASHSDTHDSATHDSATHDSATHDSATNDREADHAADATGDGHSADHEAAHDVGDNKTGSDGSGAKADH
jgi:hypothetical protein